MNSSATDRPEPSVLLLAFELSPDTAAIAAAVARRMELALHHVPGGLRTIAGLVPEQCRPVILIEAAGWDDDGLAELAAQLAFSPAAHGGIILCGNADRMVSKHLVAAGLVRLVGWPLIPSELMAALIAGIEHCSNFCRSAAPPAQEGPSLGRAPRSFRPSTDHADLRQLLRSVMVRRQARHGIFPDGLFSDPAWDILVALAEARIEGRTTQASNIGIEAGIPQSTALRRVKDLEAVGLVDRWGDPHDRRRDFVQLSTAGLEAFMRYSEKIAAAYPD